MDPLRDALQSTFELQHKVNDVRFLTTLSGQALITITYNRPIGDEWIDAITTLVETEDVFRDVRF
eukprot:CAMPEP_0194380794 /NCGR_PEP_ID=MMETSP0174-20130528/47783_1 /TAXON_ID=216777 /ORGANISM="Proboscia alata, Strain PI-D3" /LENGTH=64 /DNA_ID=CAMNT_0039164495 /DNA_START=24 /DNA_END=215 /DNA_ORIENTATION=+